MVASVADRASQRPKTFTSQRVFQARANTGLRGGQHRSLAFDQRLIKSVRDHVEVLGLEP
jgi:RNase adaptor protein for sRNA GlmZ degradation